MVFWAWNERNKREERRKRRQTEEVLNLVEEALLQNPGSDPRIVVEQLRGQITDGRDSKI